jgi:hypothetical protein
MAQISAQKPCWLTIYAFSDVKFLDTVQGCVCPVSGLNPLVSRVPFEPKGAAHGRVDRNTRCTKNLNIKLIGVARESSVHEKADSRPSWA